jgi:hypothetical protein
MSHIYRKALCATAAIALSLGADGIAVADPVEPEPHSVSQQHPAAAEAHNGSSPVVVAYNWGSAAQSAALSCKGENSWSLLCPGAEVIGVSY